MLCREPGKKNLIEENRQFFFIVGILVKRTWINFFYKILIQFLSLLCCDHSNLQRTVDLILSLHNFQHIKHKPFSLLWHFEPYRGLINDTYKMDLILIHPPHFIALACIYVASVLKDKENTAWFEELRVDMNVVKSYKSLWCYRSLLLVVCLHWNIHSSLALEINFTQ